MESSTLSLQFDCFHTELLLPVCCVREVLIQRYFHCVGCTFWCCSFVLHYTKVQARSA